MFYFWLILGLLLSILIIGIVLVLWSNTVIYIKYINGNLRLKVKNTFYTYNYPAKKKMAENVENSDKADATNSESEDLKNNKSDTSDEQEKNSDTENKNNKLFDLFKKLRNIKDIVILIKDIIKGLRYKLDIKKLEVGIDYGSGDAANTGITCGVFWTGYGIVLPVLVSYFYLDNPSVRFTPWFNDKLCEIKFESIIKVKIGHIINTLILAGVKYLKRQLNR